MTICVIKFFLQFGFCFQYQLINFAWLSFDFFFIYLKPHYLLFRGFILLCVLSKNMKCLLFIIINIFSIHFAMNLFYLHNLKT